MALAHTPFTLSGLSLPHRIVMAPMTRSRSGADGTVSALDAAYFRQRASAALIITGGIQINQVAEGYPGTPGIYRPDQVDSWREVTEAAHQAGDPFRVGRDADLQAGAGRGSDGQKENGNQNRALRRRPPPR